MGQESTSKDSTEIDVLGLAWQQTHQAMLQQEMHTSDLFLVEIASRLGISCSGFASEDTRQQYVELRARILDRIPQ